MSIKNKKSRVNPGDVTLILIENGCHINDTVLNNSQTGQFLLSDYELIKHKKESDDFPPHKLH